MHESHGEQVVGLGWDGRRRVPCVTPVYETVYLLSSHLNGELIDGCNEVGEDLGPEHT